MKTLLLILIAAVALAAILFHLYNKMCLMYQGHRLDWSDDDSVTVSDEELQEFMFEMQTAETSEIQKNTDKTVYVRYHAIA